MLASRVFVKGLLVVALVSCTSPEDSTLEQADITSGPDLLLTSLSTTASNPLNASVGTSFVLSDQTANQGTTASNTSVTRYLLSTGTTRKADMTGGARSVGSIAAAGSEPSAVSTTVTVKTGLADGDYNIVGCVDDTGTNAEMSEVNNCRLATDSGGNTFVVQLRNPDLTVTAVDEPPLTAQIGQTFSINSTTANLGGAAVASSTTTFYLSTNGASKNVAIGSRTGSLGSQDAGSSAATTLTAPGNQMSSSWYLLACADSASTVSESNEGNNCKASTGKITITGPDLIEDTVSVSPSSVAVGQKISVTETQQNLGPVATTTTTFIRAYLSLDQVRDGSDLFYRPDCGAAQGVLRAVPPLAANMASTTTTANGGLCYKASNGTIQPIPPGTYYMFVCADNTSLAGETNENNNCAASTAPFTVRNATLVALDVSPDNATITPGASQPFTATGSFSDSTTGDMTSSVTWSTSNSSVATMSANVATGVGAGTSAITATFGTVNDSTVLTVSTAAGNQSPSITSTPPSNAPANAGYTYNVIVSDPDGPTTIFSTFNDTCGGTINSSGTYTFTPTSGGTCVVGVQVCDGGSPNRCTSQTATVTKSTNQAPVITSNPTPNAPPGYAYFYNPTQIDPDGPGASWSTFNDTCGGSINSTTGQYVFMPMTTGTCVIGIQVCDGGSPNLCGTQQATITRNANQAPTITSTAPSTATVGALYTYNATRTDADGPGTTWSTVAATNTCGGTINASTGQYTFTPSTTGSCVVSIQVCDGGSPNLCATQQSSVGAGLLLHVSSLTGHGTKSGQSNNWRASADVVILDQANSAAGAGGAIVTASWSTSGLSGTVQCTTGAGGNTCTFPQSQTLSQTTQPNVTFTITNITKSGYTYNASANVVTSVVANKDVP